MKSRCVYLSRIVPLILLLAFTSESEFHENVQEKLDGYYDRNIPAKLSFFFNQSQYVPGDTIFFRALFVRTDDYQPISGRQIVNIDLIGHQGAAVLQQKIVVENGWAQNQIVIPGDLSPGAYTLVAYSNWMRNQDHRLFSYNSLLVSGTKELVIDTRQPLQFYPEGGALIRGVHNRIIAVGDPEEKVTVVDTQNRAVASVVLNRFGIGAFDLMPLENESYKGVSAGRQVAFPKVTNDPVSMIVTAPNAGGPLKIALEKSGGRDAEQSFYLTLVHARKVYYSSRISFDKPDPVVYVPHETLLPGLSLVTLFREDGTELLNRMVFIRDINKAGLKINVDRKTVSPREKVTVHVRLVNDRGEPVTGMVSVSVQDSLLLPTRMDEGTSQKRVLDDLPYSALTHPAVGEMDDNTLNDFLITQSWCRFSWKDVMNDKTFDRYPVSSFVRLTGRAIHPEEKSFGDSTRITFFLQQDALTYQAYVDPTGNFDFPLALDFQSTPVYYRVETRGRRLEGISIQPRTDVAHALALPGAKEGSASSPLGVFAAKRKLVDNAYAPSLDVKNYAQRSKEAIENSLSEYFVPDVEVRLADYLLLPTMEETFREIVSSVIHRVIDRRSVIRIFLPDEKRWGNENPLFIIDGVITDDIHYLMSLKPQDVAVIKVINSRKNKSVLGAIGENGVLIVETKIPNNARNVPRPGNTFYAIGISQPIPFPNITSDTFRPRKPIIKSCLYWNPEVVTDGNGNATFSFFTADNTGTFRILIDGITEDGEPVSGARYIKVKVLSGH